MDHKINRALYQLRTHYFQAHTFSATLPKFQNYILMMSMQGRITEFKRRGVAMGSLKQTTLKGVGSFPERILREMMHSMAYLGCKLRRHARLWKELLTLFVRDWKSEEVEWGGGWGTIVPHLMLFILLSFCFAKELWLRARPSFVM